MIGWLSDLAQRERLLAIIAIATGVLLAIALVFAILTIGLRFRSMRRATVRSRLSRISAIRW